MNRITIKQAGIKPSLYKKIKHHALASLYRMNASSADLYTFTVDTDGNNWSGGWDWSDWPSKYPEEFAINLKDGKLYKVGV